MKDAYLIVVDVQNDFLPGGALAVPHGDMVIAPINRLIEAFGERAVFTQDWHPEKHCSFATWPAHCVRLTKGAELSSELKTSPIASTIPKGVAKDSDSYSGFFRTGEVESSLRTRLSAAGARKVVICGLATDYCVKATALDARDFGFKTVVAANACRGVDVNPGDVEAAYIEMIEAGVGFSSVEDIINPTRKRVLSENVFVED